jgi:hypothetical protein
MRRRALVTVGDFTRAALLAATLALPGAANAEDVKSRPEPEQIVEIFNNGNIDAVDNGARRATTFTLDAPAVITKLSTYHWNYGRGRQPGTIALRSATGELFGPWRANGWPGQGGVPNAYWIATPEISLRPGAYTVLDSDPDTWSQNGGSRGAGFASAEGYYE